MKLLGELHTLRLAARERRGGLAQAHVAQAYIVQRLELSLDLRDIPKEGQRLGDAHVEHVRDGLATVGDLECLAVVAFTAANFAGNVDIGKEVHASQRPPLTLKEKRPGE